MHDVDFVQVTLVYAPQNSSNWWCFKEWGGIAVTSTLTLQEPTFRITHTIFI